MIGVRLAGEVEMWLILICELDGCGVDDVAIARASGWNAEAAIVGFPDPEYPRLRHQWVSGRSGRRRRKRAL